MKYFAIGDLHGNANPLKKEVKKHPEKYAEGDVLICLGDTGANYFGDMDKEGGLSRDRQFKRELSKLPFIYFMIRGNHDRRVQSASVLLKHKDGWHAETFMGNTVSVEDEFLNIKYANDIPNVYELEYNNIKKKALVVPGAYSVDKYHRLRNGWSWFEDEQLTEEEMELGRQLCILHNWKFDFIFSHTCPVIYEPTDLFLSVVDQSTVDKTMERYLGELEYQLNYKLWLWGHYHKQRIYPHIEGVGMRVMLYQDIMDMSVYF